ncbi:peptidase m61 domain-containing protein [Coniochaeta sp. 2T2.1]|nr:peptidase m61 domain-containing protein [Coniochaeta sp. 2T2.1]
MRVIHIAVDLTEASRCLIHATVQLPVNPDCVAIFTTPVWIQEIHSASGPVAGIAGLRFSSNSGESLRWRRNPLNASEYHVDVPENADTVIAAFDAIITWKDVAKIAIQASVTVPSTWGVATALENLGTPVTSSDGETKTLRYRPTNVQRLEDSPILTGRHFRRFPITADGRHILCVTVDTAGYTDVPQETLEKLSRLVAQTWAAFGPRHYDSFFFLLALSKHHGFFGGFEHHDSFEASLPLNGLSDASVLDQYGALVAHEFIHSWCGKFRRPAGHVPRDFATPLDGSMLWVYEGLSSYYEGIISVRSGLMSPRTYRKTLARKTAWIDGQTGRLWRSLEDTGTGASLSRSRSWANWSRINQDYYYEGILLWLDVDTLIRTKTDGKRSLDDFTRAFFGQGKDTGPEVVPYTLEDIVASLNKVAADDWWAFLDKKVLGPSPYVNLTGIERAGYRFFYTKGPVIGQDTDAGTREAVWNSIGIKVGDNGELEDVRRGGPADNAKLAPRQSVIRVAGSPFTPEELASEIVSKRQDLDTPMRLTMRQEDDEWEVAIDYHGGLRYPQIEHQEGMTDMLSAILATERAQPTVQGSSR